MTFIFTSPKQKHTHTQWQMPAFRRKHRTELWPMEQHSNLVEPLQTIMQEPQNCTLMILKVIRWI